MSITTHIVSLQKKHSECDVFIAEEMAHPLPNFEAITALKKHKLALKQEIERFKRYMEHPEAVAS